jgi:hypothetical protein
MFTRRKDYRLRSFYLLAIKCASKVGHGEPNPSQKAEISVRGNQVEVERRRARPTGLAGFSGDPIGFLTSTLR